MDYGVYVHGLARILQVLGLIFSSAAILGEKRLKRLEALGRKIRRLIQIRLILRATKSFVGVLLLILSGLYFIFFPIMLYKANPAPPPLPTEGVWFFIAMMIFVYLLVTVFYLGAIFMIVNSLAKTEKLSTFFAKNSTYIKSEWLIFQARAKDSILYKVFYYSIFLVVAEVVTLPLQAMNMLLMRQPVKDVFKATWANYERLFLPSSLRNQGYSRLQMIKKSLSWENYKKHFENFTTCFLCIFLCVFCLGSVANVLLLFSRQYFNDSSTKHRISFSVCRTMDCHKHHHNFFIFIDLHSFNAL